MKTIHKYKFDLLSINHTDSSICLQLPMNAKVLKIQEKGQEAYLWAEVETKNKMVEQKFFFVGTGHLLPKGFADYIDTIFLLDHVFHIYKKV